jgi:toxin secretion/phage lysis holin
MQDSLAIKAAISSVFAAIALRLGALGDLLWLFVAAVALDYITGMVAAAYNRELSSAIGFKGVLKKIGGFLVVAAALLCDEVVSQAAVQLGAEINPGGTLACVVAVWLIVNEIVSILENLARMNVALPPFLLKAAGLLKEHSEKAGE